MKSQEKRPLKTSSALWCMFPLLLCLLAACAPQQTHTTGTTINPVKTSTPSAETTASTQPLRLIRFVDQTHAWALTSTSVLRSQDGGKTWQNVTRRGNGGSMMDGGEHAEAVFQTADLAWVFVVVRKNGATQGGVTVHVWRTTDGGTNWETSTFDDNDALGVADRPNFAGPDNGWLLLETGAGAGSYGVHLYQTKDGGVSWRQIAAAPGKLPLTGEKFGPSFTDEKDGWIANHVAALADSPLIDRSSDGGVTWLPETLPLVPSLSHADYRTTPPVVIGEDILVPAHVITGTEKHLIMYVSANDGGRWYVSQPASFDTDNVYVIDADHVVALDNGSVYTSKDAGQHWSQAGTLPATAGTMSFVSAQEGWSFDTQSAALYHTTDGGASWQTITYSMVSAS